MRGSLTTQDKKHKKVNLQNHTLCNKDPEEKKKAENI